MGRRAGPRERGPTVTTTATPTRRRVFNASVFISRREFPGRYEDGPRIVNSFYCIHPERARAMAEREAANWRYVGMFASVGDMEPAWELSRAADHHFGKRFDAGEVICMKPGWWHGCECGCRDLMPLDGWSYPNA